MCLTIIIWATINSADLGVARTRQTLQVNAKEFQKLHAEAFLFSSSQRMTNGQRWKKQYRDIDKAGLMHTTCSTELPTEYNDLLIN